MRIVCRYDFFSYLCFAERIGNTMQDKCLRYGENRTMMKNLFLTIVSIAFCCRGVASPPPLAGRNRIMFIRKPVNRLR